MAQTTTQGPSYYQRGTIQVWDFIRDQKLNFHLGNAIKYICRAGHAFGVDLDKCFEEVQRSNMSKLGEDGKPIYREDGKVMKGENYSPPDLKKCLQIN